MDKNKVRLYVLVAAAFFLVLAIALLAFGISYGNVGFTKALFFVTAVLVLVFAAELAYLWLLLADVRPNFFLFNPIINRNSSVQGLDFETIDARMDKYLSLFSESEGRLWTGGFFDMPSSPIEPQFYAAVAYKLLFDLARSDNEAGWKCFLLSSDATVNFIASSIAKNGDEEMARTLLRLKAAEPINLKAVRDYIVGNKGYLRKRLKSYVIDNIGKF